MRTTIHLKPAPPFDFRGTALSHGWVVLAPNEWDEDSGSLMRVEQLSSGKVVRLEVAGEGTLRKPGIRIEIENRGRLARRDIEDVTDRLAHMFRLDEGFRGFYALCRKRGDPWTKVPRGLGRMLRSSNLFEDIVKVICTTNIQWGGTKRMVAALVEQFGEPFKADTSLKAFPTAEAISSVDADEFARRVSMGYRAPYIHELARRIVTNDLILSRLEDPSMPTAVLKKELLAIKGIGGYAAASLLMLLGRYGELPIDSVCRDFVKKRYFNGRDPSDGEIRAIYEDWDEWKFLAYWFDLWHSRS
jgi:3-methyladenine DNA glycosylase/8-oxoguanine DNA glycosylase